MENRERSAGITSTPARRAPAAGPLRALIVDDHVMVRRGLRQLLSDAFPAAAFGEAGTGQEALESIGRQAWDVVLLDIAMPGGSGLDVLTKVVNARPNTAVLVLSMHPEDQYARQVLKWGAAGYLSKDTAAEEVVNAVKKVLAGGHYVSASLAQVLAPGLNSTAEGLGHDALSERERQVLVFIASGKSTKEIAYELSLSVKTVSTYRARLLAKMKFTTNAELIRYAIRNRLVE
jgi:two-component system invasion response regulator UvrY